MEITKNILNTVKLTEDTLYDLLYDLLFFNALAESKEDIKNGRVITLEELNSYIKELEVRYENSNIK